LIKAEHFRYLRVEQLASYVHYFSRLYLLALTSASLSRTHTGPARRSGCQRHFIIAVLSYERPSFSFELVISFSLMKEVAALYYFFAEAHFAMRHDAIYASHDALLHLEVMLAI